MKLNPPAWLRATLYVLTLAGTPVVLYLQAKGYVGDLELTLWGAEVTVATTIAALNTSSTPAQLEPEVYDDPADDEPHEPIPAEPQHRA